MRLLKASLALLFLLSPHALAQGEEMAVIVNKQNPIDKLSRPQVIDLFMGRYLAFPDGTSAVPVGLPEGSPQRERFYTQLTGRSISRINAYWARIQFTGRASPPQTFQSEAAVVEKVSATAKAIGYVTRSHLTDGVKVVLSLDEPH